MIGFDWAGFSLISGGIVPDEFEIGNVSGAEDRVLAGFILNDSQTLAFQALHLGAVLGEAAGFLFLGFPALFFEAEFFGLVADAAQLGELLGGANDGTTLLGIVGGDENALKEATEGEQGGDGGAVGEGDGAGVTGQIIGFLDELCDPGAGILVAQPIFESTLPPLAEVLFVDGTSAEAGFKDFLDFRQAVEPLDEGGAEFAIGEPAVELFANGARESGDFTVAGHGNVECGMWNDE